MSFRQGSPLLHAVAWAGLHEHPAYRVRYSQCRLRLPSWYDTFHGRAWKIRRSGQTGLNGKTDSRFSSRTKQAVWIDRPGCRTAYRGRNLDHDINRKSCRRSRIAMSSDRYRHCSCCMKAPARKELVFRFSARTGHFTGDISRLCHHMTSRSKSRLSSVRTFWTGQPGHASGSA